MCKSPLHPFLAALPKCEHHIHIEGSLSPELLFELAVRNGVDLPGAEEDPAFTSPEALHARYERFASLDDFLAYYYVGFRVLLSAADFESLGLAYLRRAHAHGVRHAEVFFDPQAHLGRGVALATVVGGLTAARRRAEAELGITSHLIPCLLRHLPVADSAATFAQIRDAGHFADGTLAGLGLCSTELGMEPRLWRDIFAQAGRAGIRLTAHAGEEGPAAYVAMALDELGVQRIDHGVNASRDPALVARLARDRVLLSVCPISNVRLRGRPSIAHVPIRAFLDAGVPFSINSDDPAYFGGYILDNYCAVQDAFGLDLAEWATIARNSVEGSWCDRARKDALLAEVAGVVGEWERKLAV